MRKTKRKKMVIGRLETLLEKCQRRIVAISEEAYKLRQQIAIVNAMPKGTTLTKAEREAKEQYERDAEIANNQAQEEAVADTADQEIGNTTEA